MTSSVLFIGEVSLVAPFVEKSLEKGHPTSVLVRKSSFVNPLNVVKIQRFRSLGAHIAPGKLSDHQSLVKAVKDVDVVFSLKPAPADADKIVSAIREAGNRKVFIPLRPANANDAENRALFQNYPPHQVLPYEPLPPPQGYHQVRPYPYPQGYYQVHQNYAPHQVLPPYGPHPQTYAPYPPHHQISPIEALLRAIPALGFAFDVFQYFEG